MKRHFGPYTVETSNEDKVLYAGSGITKGDVIEYYDAMYEYMRPHLDDRCLTLERYPDGIDEVRAFAKTVAATVADEHPSRFTVEQRKESRQGRLYIDVGRNAYGQTGVLPYSLRVLDGAPAATPLDWDELGRDDFSPRRFGLENMRARLGQKNDPFEHFASHNRRPRLDL